MIKTQKPMRMSQFKSEEDRKSEITAYIHVCMSQLIEGFAAAAATAACNLQHIRHCSHLMLVKGHSAACNCRELSDASTPLMVSQVVTTCPYKHILMRQQEVY